MRRQSLDPELRKYLQQRQSLGATSASGQSLYSSGQIGGRNASAASSLSPAGPRNAYSSAIRGK